MDIVIFDRQYSPFVFTFKEQNIIPIESVYAVFEVKQTIDLSMVNYAKEKITSVRALSPTSLPIPMQAAVILPNRQSLLLEAYLH